MKKIKVNYAKHEKTILKNTIAELMGWWRIAEDYLSLAKKNDGFTVKEYSVLAAKVARDYKENTIAQNIGHCMWAMDSGWKITASGVKDATGAVVKSMGHLRRTKNPPKKNVKVATTKKSDREETLRQLKNYSRETREYFVRELLKTL